jgi:hypothetical protein
MTYLTLMHLKQLIRSCKFLFSALKILGQFHRFKVIIKTNHKKNLKIAYMSFVWIVFSLIIPTIQLNYFKVFLCNSVLYSFYFSKCVFINMSAMHITTSPHANCSHLRKVTCPPPDNIL